MVLVDTSVWLRFLAGRALFASGLDQLLERGEVLAHELVQGELLLGDRGGRRALLASYQKLLCAPTVPHQEVLELVRSRKFGGRGIGWVDAHLLGSALVVRGAIVDCRRSTRCAFGRTADRPPPDSSLGARATSRLR